MAKHIEPKPTTYQGQLFRSRLEARWAVCLDRISNVISWQYEPHVITLNNGWTYTPDFLVTFFVDGHKQHIYLECKPARISDDYDKFLTRITKELKYGIFAVMSNMYDEDYIFSTLYVNGTSQGVPVMSLFKGFPEAYTLATHYRFDLKGN